MGSADVYSVRKSIQTIPNLKDWECSRERCYCDRTKGVYEQYICIMTGRDC